MKRRQNRPLFTFKMEQEWCCDTKSDLMTSGKHINVRRCKQNKQGFMRERLIKRPTPRLTSCIYCTCKKYRSEDQLSVKISLTRNLRFAGNYLFFSRRSSLLRDASSDSSWGLGREPGELPISGERPEVGEQIWYADISPVVAAKTHKNT